MNRSKPAKRKRQRRARAQVNEALELLDTSDSDNNDHSEIENNDNDNNDSDNVNEYEINDGNGINNNANINENEIDNEINFNEDTDDEGNNLSDDGEGRNVDSEDELDEEDRFLYEEVIAEANEQLQNGNQEEYLLRVLREWARRGVSLKKIDMLLKLLHPVHPFLPLTHNALLKTPHRVGALRPLGCGKFWYKGIMKNLEQRLTQEYLQKHNEIIIDTNIDGLSPFQSTTDEIWPILGRLKDTTEPFIIAAFFGKGKPSNLDEFLREYKEEVVEFTTNGVHSFGNLFNFNVRNYILDAPARAFVKCIVGHNGRFSCEKCETQSVHVNHTQTYPDLDAPLRTNESFLNRNNALHHEGVSPLEDIPTGMISSFRLDSLHLVHGGVMKRWLLFLLGRKNRRGILNQEQITDLDNRINNIASHVPRDFNRRPRRFAFISKFHATEYRRILLYDGLVLFKDLDPDLWKSFKLLHASMFILSSPSLCKREELLNVANVITRRFVQHSIVHLGGHFPVYNVHALTHLTDECRENGALDEFSAYPYENYLGVIKSLLRSRYKPLEQLRNRDTERGGRLMQPKSDLQPGGVTLMHHNNFDRDEEVEGRQYAKVVLGRTFLSTSEGDNCFKCKNGTIFLLKNILYTNRREIIFVAQRFCEMEDYYVYPLQSSLLGVWKVSDIGNEKIYIDIGEFKEKCVLLPCGVEEYVALPLYHSQDQI